MRVKILNIDGRILNTLPEGHHAIGRSTSLNCNDKRVSRKHATITIDHDEAILSAVHVNPCYYKSAQSNNTIILKQDNEVRLHNNDKFGLLPDSFWYQVEFVKDDDKIQPTNGNETTAATTASLMDDPTNGCADDDEKRCLDIEAIVETISKKKIKLEGSQTATTIDDSFSFVENRPINEQIEESPTDLNNQPLYVPMQTDETDKTQCDDTIADERSNDITQPSTSKLTDQRNSCNDNNDNKDNNQPSTSNDNNEPPTSNVDGKKKQQRREHCWYGASCYRKNPLHRQEFSHPDDADYASDPDDDRPICVFGAACYRRNKLHRQDYKHPTSPLPRKIAKRKKDTTATTTAKKTKQADDLNETPEDDYDYEDPFIDDGESDEYVAKDDDDDDTDWEDSENPNEDSEDVKRLLKEAKRFTGNSK